MTEPAIYRALKYRLKYDPNVMALRWKYVRWLAIQNFWKAVNAHAIVDEWLTDALKDQMIQRGERDRVEKYVYQWMTSNDAEKSRYEEEITRWGENNGVNPDVTQQIINQLPSMATKIYNYITSYLTEYEATVRM
jgi:hypothetical protein